MIASTSARVSLNNEFDLVFIGHLFFLTNFSFLDSLRSAEFIVSVGLYERRSGRLHLMKNFLKTEILTESNLARLPRVRSKFKCLPGFLIKLAQSAVHV